ncbi:MAG: acyl-CoA desaturase [Proteobacteria bacterium]|nr:acyl-CoA desaturase [Pseudomonadota bacterium]
MKTVARSFSNEKERYRSFAQELNEVYAAARARMGDEDVAHVKRLNRFSRSSEAAGRLLIHFSFEPVGFAAGVLALWVHKQLQATEIGHPALHGCYDHLEGAEKFHSKNFSWDIGIDEEAWDEGHNRKHHPYTNVTGRDPDINFGPVRLNAQTPHRPIHYIQVPYTVLVLWPSFALGMNTHFTGLLDVFRDEPEMLKDKSRSSVLGAVKKALRKAIPHYGKEYVFYPALAGPFWWKVALGNWTAGTLRNVYSAASIFCGHIGSEVVDYPEGTKAKGRGHWYEMQVQSAQNFQVPYVLSVLCGGLDYQIEHHLFPKLPPERLREIAPDVQRICAEHGVSYRTGSWVEILGDAFGQLWQLSFPEPTPAFAGAMG